MTNSGTPSPIRVLMLNNEYPPLGGGTGTVNKAWLVRFCNNNEFQIDLVTSAGAEQTETINLAPNIRLIKLNDGRQDIHHGTNRDLISYTFKALPVAARLHSEYPYHLVFAWSALPAGVIAWLLKQRFKLPYIVRVSGPDIPGFEARYGWLYPFLTPIIRQVWHGAAQVVAKCQDEARMIERVDKHRTNVKIIPNGVDVASFHQAQGSPLGSPLQVLCVARLIERKGQRLLIQAAQRLLDAQIPIHVHLVGDGDSLSDYQSLAVRLGVQTMVTFHGYIPREEITATYAAMDVFVLASYNEGMSVATLEAMAAGLPIIATRAGGMADLVIPGETGFLFNWGDLDDLVYLLGRLAQNRQKLHELGAGSRKRAALFAWDTAVKESARLLRLVASKSNLKVFQT